jgi:hypothetical protein
MFDKTDFKNMDTVLLKRLCKRVGIKKYSKLKKQELFWLYNRHLAIISIQRTFRTYFYRESVDHITLEPVQFPCFIYKTKSGKCYFYNYESIIKYIMKTGNTRDPMTREAYSDNDLKRLDNQAKLYFPGIKYRSTYKIKTSLVYAHRIRNRENEILSFQMRMDELKELILFIISSDISNWNIGNEPILIENVEYQSIDSFINSVIHELKMVVTNLRAYDSHQAELFKTDLINEIPDNSKILELVNNI